MKIRCGLIGLMLSLLCMHSFAQSSEPLRVGTTGLFAPMSFYQRGELQGLDIDLARDFAASLGRPIVFKTFALGELLQALEQGEIDIISSGLSLTPERLQHFAFSDSYLSTAQVALIRSDKIATLGEVHQMNRAAQRVGVVAHSSGERLVRKHLAQAEVLLFPSFDQALGALEGGELDYLVHDELSAAWLGQQGRLGNVISLNINLNALVENEEREQLAWAMQRDNQTLQAQANHYLQALRANGELQQHIERWIWLKVDAQVPKPSPQQP